LRYQGASIDGKAMTRMFRFLLLGLLAALPTAAGAEPLAIAARPIALDSQAPERERVGSLAWRGGLVLSSPHARFGGLSGLSVSADGSRLVAVTDRGDWVTARLAYDGAGRLAGLAQAEIGALRGLNGAPMKAKRHQDAESIAGLADGSLVVAFEREHRLRRYPAGAAPLAGVPSARKGPARLDGAGRNSGVEALAALADGALLAIVEGGKSARESAAYVERDGGWARLVYPHAAGYRPTGAARLPGGDVLVIERRFNVIEGVAIRLRRVAAGTIRPGARLAPEGVAHLSAPLAVDNIEGVAARAGPDGETLVYLVSDDNFNGLQRTLLLMFALVE
jgi:hypothetical protein